MAAISNEDLKVETLAILRTVDLTITSSKKVRLDLEQKLHCDLADRKKEIAAIIAQYVADNVKDEEPIKEEQQASDSDSGADTKRKSKSAAVKRSAATASAAAGAAKKSKKSAANSSQSGSSSSSEELEDVAPVRGGKKKAAGKEKGTAAAGKGSGTGKGNSFTRPFKLSPELASLMGEESLPRHEVVRKVWALIKERNLYDPKNKQFAICDADLMTVIGVKRFRTFGMLKYLKKHFVE